jgi:uncharacterized membrane protein SpoIIM required for sporulation
MPNSFSNGSREMKSAEKLTGLVTRLQRRPSALDLQSFPLVYRTGIAELAEARAEGTPAYALRPLEMALVAAHGLLYAPPGEPLGRSIIELLRIFPRATRAAARSVAAAAALVVTGVVWGYWEIWHNPASAANLLGDAWLENAEAFRENGLGHGANPILGVFYYTHNSSVAFYAYAFGVTFGVGTVLGLLYNGILLGGTIAVVQVIASPRALLAFVLPHVGIELTAIVIAAAGGLTIAAALIAPGWRTRTSAMMIAARRSIPLAIGATFLLAVAGLLEGWVSPSSLPLVSKAVIGLTVDTGLLIYLLIA